MLMRQQLEIMSILLICALLKVVSNTAVSTSEVDTPQADTGDGRTQTVKLTTLAIDSTGTLSVNGQQFTDPDALAQYLISKGKVNVQVTGDGNVPIERLKSVKRSFDKLHLNLYF